MPTRSAGSSRRMLSCRYAVEIATTARTCVIREDGVADACTASVVLSDDQARGTLSWACSGLIWQDGWPDWAFGAMTRGTCPTNQRKPPISVGHPPVREKPPVHRITRIDSDIENGGRSRDVAPAAFAGALVLGAGALVGRRASRSRG